MLAVSAVEDHSSFLLKALEFGSAPRFGHRANLVDAFVDRLL
jgi:hypothetical protein